MATLPAPPLAQPGQPSPMPSSMISEMSKAGVGQQQQGSPDGIQQLKQEVEALAKQTLKVGQLAQAVHPPLMAFIEKFIQIGKAIQGQVDELSQSRGAPPQSGASPPPNPAEAAPSGTGA